MKRPRPAVQRVRDLLAYEPDTGALRWRVTRGRVRAGAIAGCTFAHGYTVVMIDYASVPAHVAAWAITHGQWPDDEIDHANGVRSDNRMCNLRAATRAQNQHNKRGHGRTGAKGVTYCKRERKFVAGISRGGRRKHLGYFDDVQTAKAAYDAAAIAMFGAFATDRTCTARDKDVAAARKGTVTSRKILNEIKRLTNVPKNKQQNQ